MNKNKGTKQNSFFNRTEEFERQIGDELHPDILLFDGFQRLKKLRFLGIYDYITNLKDTKYYTRYDHTVAVAYLTLLYCKNLNIDPIGRKFLVLAALLHDVGLGPLVHSTEGYQLRRSGFKHDYHSTMKSTKFRSIVNEISDYLPKDLIRRFENSKKMAVDLQDLIYGKWNSSSLFDNEYINLLFYNPFCPDTFDGVGRGLECLPSEGLPESIDPESLVNEISTNKFPLIISCEKEPDQNHIIMRFHNRMELLYKNQFNDRNNMAAEAMVLRCMECALPEGMRISYSNKGDDYIINRISDPAISKKSSQLFSLVLSGEWFFPLSPTDSRMFIWAKNEFRKILSRHQKYFYESLINLEEKIANQYNLKQDYVITYVFSRLIWDRKNIQFKKVLPGVPQDKLWRVIWDKREGTKENDLIFEVYLPTKYMAKKFGFYKE